MAFCPKCRYEYVPGIKECPDCRVDLVDHLKADPVPDQLEWLDLVTIADFQFELEAQAAKLKLESFGIRAAISNNFIAQTSVVAAFMTGGIHLMVEREDAQQALAVLAEGANNSEL